MQSTASPTFPREAIFRVEVAPTALLNASQRPLNPPVWENDTRGSSLSSDLKIVSGGRRAAKAPLGPAIFAQDPPAKDTFDWTSKSPVAVSVSMLGTNILAMQPMSVRSHSLISELGSITSQARQIALRSQETPSLGTMGRGL